MESAVLSRNTNTHTAKSSLPSISCIVPALNECKNLAVLLPSLAEKIARLGSAWEIIVVDDGSSDETPEMMTAWSSRPGYRYMQFSRNFGKEAALSAGLEASQGDIVICLDADLQHPVSLIDEMVKRWQNGADSVYAVRANRTDESRIKRYGSALLYFILGQGNRVHIPPGASDFRLMDRSVVDALLQMPERSRFMKGLFAWVGFKVESIEYMPPRRLHGSSHFNILKLARFAIDGITAFSTWPLRVLSLIGALVALMSFAYGSYLFLAYFFVGNEVSGWTTIVTTMLFLSGINLLGLGVIGIYVGRLFEEVKQRPLYVLRKNLGIGMKRSAT